MYFNIVQSLVCKTVIRLHQVSFWPVDLLVKMLVTFERRGIIGSMFLLMYYHPPTGMYNGDDASPSIILVGRALLVKLLITFETLGIFGLNFVYSCILTLAIHLYAKR